MLQSKNTPGFYSTGEIVSQLPLEPHPIQHKKIREDIWTRTPYKIELTRARKEKPPGLIGKDTLRWNTLRLVVRSYESVYNEGNIGSEAWMIQENEQEHAPACFLMQHVLSTTSCRAELERAFRLLKHIKLCEMESTEVDQWCDNL